ncbi:MAG TPA: D-arabinono-1,4-lactone oxidase [Rhizomicrobium sp.]
MRIVGGKWSNWSGGVTSKPKQVIAPKDEVALAAAIRSTDDTVRAPGSGHSFTPVCASDGMIVDLAAFTGLKSVDKEKLTATFGAATPLWAIGPTLLKEGLGLKNMGDIDRQTLGGVVGTGTHGTGRTLGSFSAAVAGFKIITANGDLLNCTPDENADVFAAGRCSIGTLGVMTEITMHVRPAYRLVEKNFLLPPDELFSKLDNLVNENRHFEFFWFPYADVAICKSLNETTEVAPEPRSAKQMYERGEKGSSQEKTFAAINAVLPYTPFLLKRTHNLFSQLMPGAPKVRWSNEILPSPRTVRFNEMEYAVPYAKGPDAIREVVAKIRKDRINTGFPIEYRSIAADDVWISPFQGRESATIAVHQYRTVDTKPYFDACEAIFKQYEGRPHWGKRHSRTSHDLAPVYPEFGRFQALRKRLDPKGKFLNAHLRTIFE